MKKLLAILMCLSVGSCSYSYTKQITQFTDQASESTKARKLKIKRLMKLKRQREAAYARRIKNRKKNSKSKRKSKTDYDSPINTDRIKSRIKSKTKSKVSSRSSSKPKISTSHKKYTSNSRSFEVAVKHVFESEGGYSDQENDATGEVRYGITGTTARRNGYKGSMRNLPKSFAKRIYKKQYWDILPQHYSGKAKFILFDAAVNQGPGYARKLARQSGGNVSKMISMREARYRDVARRKPGLRKFLKGWLNRLRKVSKIAKTDHTL